MSMENNRGEKLGVIVVAAAVILLSYVVSEVLRRTEIVVSQKWNC